MRFAPATRVDLSGLNPSTVSPSQLDMSSLVEVTHFPLAEAQPDNRLTEATDRRRETNILALAWRSRWLLLLMMLVGAGGAWTLLERVKPRYTSMSRIYVERNLPRLL